MHHKHHKHHKHGAPFLRCFGTVQIPQHPTAVPPRLDDRDPADDAPTDGAQLLAQAAGRRQLAGLEAREGLLQRRSQRGVAVGVAGGFELVEDLAGGGGAAGPRSSPTYRTCAISS